MSADSERERLAKLEQRQDDQADRFRQLWPLTELFGRLDERITAQDRKIDGLEVALRDSEARWTERAEEIEQDAKHAREAATARGDKRRDFNLAMVAAAISAVGLLFIILGYAGVFN